MKKICVICNKEFENQYAQTKCCSKECSKELARRNQKEISRRQWQKIKARNKEERYTREVVCPTCGKTFTRINNQIYCSTSCRKRPGVPVYEEPKKKIMTLEEKERIARDLGVSYGEVQYHLEKGDLILFIAKRESAKIDAENVYKSCIGSSGKGVRRGNSEG